MCFLGLLDLSLSLWLSAHSLEHLSGDILAHTLAVNMGDDGGDDVLDILADGVLVAGDVPANNNGLGGAVGLGVASLANDNGLSDDLADGDNMVDKGGSICKSMSKEELSVGVSIGRGGGEGGGGQ